MYIKVIADGNNSKFEVTEADVKEVDGHGNRYALKLILTLTYTHPSLSLSLSLSSASPLYTLYILTVSFIGPLCISVLRWL